MEMPTEMTMPIAIMCFFALILLGIIARSLSWAWAIIHIVLTAFMLPIAFILIVLGGIALGISCFFF
jgi:hypothetical protein